jgi:hypothetical protein
MTEPPLFAEVTQLIRDGHRTQAVELLMAAISELPTEWHRKAYGLAGLAWYFDARYPEAVGMFGAAAAGSEIPEDHFNVAMAKVKVGDIPGAHASWQRCFDLSYQHQDAPATSSFFQKKLLFAQALLVAGAPDERGLDLLERQLMGFFTHHHITDASFWGLRGVPALEEVLPLTKDYYRAMGRSEAEWHTLCDQISPDMDEEGQAYVAQLRGWGGPPAAS